MQPAMPSHRRLIQTRFISNDWQLVRVPLKKKFETFSARSKHQTSLSRRHYAHSQNDDSINVDTLTITKLHKLLETKKTSVTEICRAHLTRIRQLNPILNCVTWLSASCLQEAASQDARLKSGKISTATHPLLGVPVLLKDNFDVQGQATTAGCAALHGNVAAEDAPAVTALQRAGALILGKTNMHELALEGLTVSSLAGQTRNPFDKSRTPGGSSGGSGAAVAAGMCVLATGTDTVNSLRSPASACGIVAVRPTRGLVSTAGVQPVSWTQDAVGIMGRSVEDVAAGLDVLQDKLSCRLTRSVQGFPKSEFERRGDTLRGKRLGLLTDSINRQSLLSDVTCVSRAMDSTVDSLRAAGAHVVEVSDQRLSAERLLAELDASRHEIRHAMDGYLQRIPVDSGPRSLRSIFETKNFLVIPAQYEYMASALDPACGPHSAEYAAIQQGISDLKQLVAEVFDGNKLDAIIHPQQKNLVVPVGSRSQAGRNGILAALCGVPSICIPMGFSEQTHQAPRGIPMGMEMLGRPYGEARLLQLADEVEQLLDCSRVPPMAEQTQAAGVEQQDDLHVLTKQTDDLSLGGNGIPAAYAMGQLRA